MEQPEQPVPPVSGPNPPASAIPLPGQQPFARPTFGYGAPPSFGYGAPPSFGYSLPPYGGPAPAQPPRQGVSAWIIVLVAVSSLSLILGLVATVISAVTLAGSAASWVPYDDGLYGDYGDESSYGFGAAARFGEYVGTGEFDGVTSIDGLDVGVCFSVDGTDDDFIGDPIVKPCSEAHEYEVYAVKTLGGGTFPGADATYDEVYDTCDGKFASYIGSEYDDSLADFGGLAPTEQSWEDGERGLVCFAFKYDVTRSGPLRDSGE